MFLYKVKKKLELLALLKKIGVSCNQESNRFGLKYDRPKFNFGND